MRPPRPSVRDDSSTAPPPATDSAPVPHGRIATVAACRSRRRAHRVAAPVALAGALLAAGTRSADGQQMPPSPVRCDAVRLEKVQERRRVSGNVRAGERTRVAAREPGLTVEAPVREGQRVAKGAVLARLDDARLRLDLDVVSAERRAAESVVAERKDDLEQRRRDVETLRSLAARNATNPRELSDAETAATMAASRVRNAESQLGVFDARIAVLRLRIEDMTVRAPFDGVVVTRPAAAGSWVREGDAVAELISGETEAWLDVPQRDWPFLSALARGATGGIVRIESESAARGLDAAILRLLPDVDPRSRTFPLVAALPAEAGLVAGMSVNGWVPTGAEAEHLTVANDAILRSETGAYVYVATPGAAAPGGGAAAHSAVPVPVEVVFVADGRTAVRSAHLQKGALAIVEGNERLFPSAPVAPIAAGSAPQTPAAPGGGR